MSISSQPHGDVEDSRPSSPISVDDESIQRQLFTLPSMPTVTYEIPDFTKIMIDMRNTHAKYIVATEKAHKAMGASLAAANRRSACLSRDNERLLRESTKSQKRQKTDVVEDKGEGEGGTEEILETPLKAGKITQSDVKAMELGATNITKLAALMKIKVHGIDEAIKAGNNANIIKKTVDALLRSIQITTP
jgi:hypothetical protein